MRFVPSNMLTFSSHTEFVLKHKYVLTRNCLIAIKKMVALYYIFAEEGKSDEQSIKERSDSNPGFSRRQHRNCKPLNTSETLKRVERVSSFKYLDIHISEDLSCPSNLMLWTAS